MPRCINPNGEMPPMADRAGFTLVETLVSMFLATLVLAAVASSILGGHRTWFFNQASNQNVGRAALTVYQIAHGGKDGAWGLRQAEAGTVRITPWKGTNERGTRGWHLHYELNESSGFAPMDVFYHAENQVISNSVSGILTTNVVDSYIRQPQADQILLGVSVRRDNPSLEDTVETLIFVRN